jgi:hypothetical protein
MHRSALLLEDAERSLRRAHPELKRIIFAGDLRRGCELVADLSLVAEAPDAHSTREIALTHWGVEIARKGGVPARRVLNCFPLPKLIQHLHKRR